MTIVAVCGASLLTSIIADRLAATPSMTVVPIDPAKPGAATRLLAAHPDVALIEHSAGDACGANDRLLLALLRTGRELPVVQVDAADGVLLYTSRRLAVDCVETLVGLMSGIRQR